MKLKDKGIAEMRSLLEFFKTSLIGGLFMLLPLILSYL
jgi:hypothetical protein